VILRCIDYSENSQVAFLSTPDLGQVHVIAKGSRRPRKDGRMPLDVLTHCDMVLSRRAAGMLHIAADWSIRESFPILRKDLRRFWAAFYASEVVFTCPSENPDDGPVCEDLLTFLRQLDQGENERLVLFVFLLRVLRTMGHVPLMDRCAHCGGTLDGPIRFSAQAGGALCGDCAVTDPSAFSVSRGALAVVARLASKAQESRTLRVTATQIAEIQRAFSEQIQYHLGKPLRTTRFLVQASEGRLTTG